MLIPSIDLKNGHVVQLVQGEKLAVEDRDIDAWVQRFAKFSRVQLIDLDAAMGLGTNWEVVRRICGQLPCQVGGGIRSVERAQEVLAAGAKKVIVSSALFTDGKPDLDFAKKLADAIGVDKIIAAVDSRGGHVAIRGWKEILPIATVDAVKALEPFCSEFLYTHVDAEGLMKGTDMAAIDAIRQATTRHLTAAGGITTKEEVAQLDALGIDAVVGMAIYTGAFKLE